MAVPHTVSNRGFIHTDVIEGTDNCQVRVYQSSCGLAYWPQRMPDGSVVQGEAEGPFIWLRVSEMPFGSELNEAFAHLPLDAARKLRDALSFLIEQAEEQ